MKIKKLSPVFTICKLKAGTAFSPSQPYTFYSVTDEEASLLCPTEFVPKDALRRDDNWRGFRLEGVLDFSLIGILSAISSILAENKIGLFAVSTFNTDYIFVKEHSFERALSLLAENGYEIV